MAAGVTIGSNSVASLFPLRLPLSCNDQVMGPTMSQIHGEQIDVSRHNTILNPFEEGSTFPATKATFGAEAITNCLCLDNRSTREASFDGGSSAVFVHPCSMSCSDKARISWSDHFTRVNDRKPSGFHMVPTSTGRSNWPPKPRAIPMRAFLAYCQIHCLAWFATSDYQANELDH